MGRRVSGSCERTGLPMISTVPAVGRMSPARIRSRVLLPAPFGPNTTRASPWRIARSRPRSTLRLPNARSIPFPSNTGRSVPPDNGVSVAADWAGRSGVSDDDGNWDPSVGAGGGGRSAQDDGSTGRHGAARVSMAAGPGPRMRRGNGWARRYSEGCELRRAPAPGSGRFRSRDLEQVVQLGEGQQEPQLVARAFERNDLAHARPHAAE